MRLKKANISWRKRLAYGLIAATLLAVVCEGGLQLACLYVPAVGRVLGSGAPQSVDDPVFGIRPNPAFAEHDEAGFRNERRPERAPIVAIGDSQTYGWSVAREHAWPQVLAKEAGVTTYNMAFPSFGPAHYKLLAEEAAALQPDLLVMGFYAGNDLYDAYELVYVDHQATDLAVADPALVARFAAAHAERDLIAGWKEASSAGKDERHEDPGVFRRARRFVDDHSKLQALYERLKAAARGETPYDPPTKWSRYKQRAERAADPNVLLAFDADGIRTLLTPRSRLDVLELDDPRIAAGVQVSHAAFASTRDRFEDTARLLVLLIPTKELVFFDRVADPPEALRRLAALEGRLWTETKAYLDAEGIAWVDGLPALRSCLAEGVSPYDIDNNGHPNPAGQRALAEALADHDLVRQAGAGGGQQQGREDPSPPVPPSTQEKPS